MPYRKVGTLEWIWYMIKLKFENLIWPDDDEITKPPFTGGFDLWRYLHGV